MSNSSVIGLILYLGLSGAALGITPVADSAKPPTGNALASTNAHQAVDALVQQGASLLTRTDIHGAKVVEIKLQGKQFNNQVIEQLRWFPDLESLRCLDTSVDDGLLKQLDGFPRLRVLGLFNAAITDVGLAILAKSKTGSELRQLLIGKTQITDTGMGSIAQLPKLYLLEVSSTQITDAGFKQLLPLSNLRVLRFRRTAVTDQAMATLGQLSKLMFLSVGGSQVTAKGIAQLRQKIPGVVVSGEEITLSVEER